MRPSRRGHTTGQVSLALGVLRAPQVFCLNYVLSTTPQFALSGHAPGYSGTGGLRAGVQRTDVLRSTRRTLRPDPPLRRRCRQDDLRALCDYREHTESCPHKMGRVRSLDLVELRSIGDDVNCAGLAWADHRLRSTGRGKHVARFSYYHADLIARSPDVEEFLETTRHQFNDSSSEFNVVKLSRSRLSFLLYESFSVPFPALLAGLTCDLAGGSGRFV